MQPKRISAIKNSYSDHPLKHKPKAIGHVDEKIYRKVLRRIMELIAKELIVEGSEVTLPSRLGSLQIIKYKPKNKKKFINIDFKKTKEVFGEYNKGKDSKDKKYVYHRNWHTNGYMVKLYWRKLVKANFKNKSKWAFDFTRPNKRPNTYNKSNPEVSLVPYIMSNGVDHYHEY